MNQTQCTRNTKRNSMTMKEFKKTIFMQHLTFILEIPIAFQHHIIIETITDIVITRLMSNYPRWKVLEPRIKKKKVASSIIPASTI